MPDLFKNKVEGLRNVCLSTAVQSLIFEEFRKTGLFLPASSLLDPLLGTQIASDTKLVVLSLVSKARSAYFAGECMECYSLVFTLCFLNLIMAMSL